MTYTITGLFDTREAAQNVVDHLVKHDGVDRDRIRVHGQEVSGGSTSAAAGSEDQGIWASLKSLFMPDEDRYVYSEGIRRGGVVVSVEMADGQVDHVMDVFESNGAVDLSSREAEWRNSGWTGYDAGATRPMPSTDYAPGGVGLAASGVPSGGIGVPAGGVTGSAMTDTSGTGLDRDMGHARQGATGRTGDRDVIPVVEEQLRVGKRETDRGRVRVRSYVVETPVTEQVSLREEHVHVERRPVDRPLTDADDAFRERTIEAVEHSEEAVVSKEARVVEEITVNKEVDQRQETVHDTVRRQEVEVEDDRTGTTASVPRNPV